MAKSIEFTDAELDVLRFLVEFFTPLKTHKGIMTLQHDPSLEPDQCDMEFLDGGETKFNCLCILDKIDEALEQDEQ